MAAAAAAAGAAAAAATGAGAVAPRTGKSSSSGSLLFIVLTVETEKDSLDDDSSVMAKASHAYFINTFVSFFTNAQKTSKQVTNVDCAATKTFRYRRYIIYHICTPVNRKKQDVGGDNIIVMHSMILGVVLRLVMCLSIF